MVWKGEFGNRFSTNSKLTLHPEPSGQNYLAIATRLCFRRFRCEGQDSRSKSCTITCAINLDGAVWVRTGKSASCAHKSGAHGLGRNRKNEAFWWAHQTLEVTKGHKESEQKPRLSRIGWSNGRCRPEMGACAHNNACSA